MWYIVYRVPFPTRKVLVTRLQLCLLFPIPFFTHPCPHAGTAMTESLAPSETALPTFDSVTATSVTVLWILPLAPNGHVSHYLLRITAQDYINELTITAGLVCLFYSRKIVIASRTVLKGPILTSCSYLQAILCTFRSSCSLTKWSTSATV